MILPLTLKGLVDKKILLGETAMYSVDDYQRFTRIVWTLGELKVMRLSKIFASSIRSVKKAYMKLVKGFWNPEINYTENGDLEIEGYRFSFYQAKPDIIGGKGEDLHGNKYFMRGGNQLERIRLLPLIDFVGRRIAVLIMIFRGEEHPKPSIDSIYRAFRRIAFNRLKDIEAIGIEFDKDKLRIAFRGICSDKKTFASMVGAHKTCIVESEKTENSIYTSNVWNHAMATWNTNPNIDQVKMRPQIDVGLLKTETIEIV
jgi:hypothetical protein